MISALPLQLYFRFVFAKNKQDKHEQIVYNHCYRRLLDRYRITAGHHRYPTDQYDLYQLRESSSRQL